MISTPRRAHPTSPDTAGHRARRARHAAVLGVAALALGAFTAAPALAGSGDDGSREPIAVAWQQHEQRRATGTIAAIDGTNVVVTRPDGSALTVTVSDTTITTTTVATLAELTPGSFVTVRVRSADDGSLAAKRIDLRPAPAGSATGEVADWNGRMPWHRSVSGAVESFDPATGTLTLGGEDGPVTLTTTADTKVTRTAVLTVADLVVGARVRLGGTFLDDGTFAARRVHVLAASATTAPPTTEATTSAPPSTDAPSRDDSLPYGGEREDGSSPSNSRYQGTVSSVDGATFELVRRDGTVVTVVTTDATEFGAWSRHGDDGQAAAGPVEVTVGAWVKVKGSLAGDVLTAEKVSVGSPPVPRSDDERWGDEDGPAGPGGRDRAHSIGENEGEGGYWTPDSRPSSGSTGRGGRR